MTNSNHVAWIAYLLPLLAILVPSVLTWARDLNAQARRMRTLDECKKIVDFWDSWIKATIAANPVNRSSYDDRQFLIENVSSDGRTHLERAARIASRIYVDEFEVRSRKYRFTFVEFHKYKEGLNRFRRALLLYRPANPASAAYQKLFHAIPAFLVTEFIVIRTINVINNTPIPIPAIDKHIREITDHLPQSTRIKVLLLFSGLLCGMLYILWSTLRRCREKAIARENDQRLYLWEEDPEIKGLRTPVKYWE